MTTATAPFRPPTIQLGALFNRPTPQAPEAEAALLGAIILDPTILSDVREIVPTPGMFYSEPHAAIFEALVALQDSNRGGDLVQLVNRLRTNEVVWREIGGVAYLEKLAIETPGAAGAVYWAGIVRNKWRVRRMIELCGQTIHAGYTNTSDDPTEVFDALEQGVFELATHNIDQQTCQPLSALMDAEFERLQSRDGGAGGIPTGFADLDNLIGGLKPGDMAIIGGRPSMGKTSVGLDIARSVAMRGHPVGVFSMEMTRKAVTSRLWAACEGVSVQRTINNTLTDIERHQLLGSRFVTNPPPIEVDDAAGLSVSQVRSRARKMVRKSGVQLIVIDYLQLMREPGKQESRQVEVSRISSGLKALAKELDIPIVVLAQLNRNSESRQGNRPRMSDLRESGSIEQDADLVALIHREEFYHIGDDAWHNDPENADKLGTGELILEKQRNGPTGLVTLTWRAECSSFANHAASDRRYPGSYTGGE